MTGPPFRLSQYAKGFATLNLNSVCWVRSNELDSAAWHRQGSVSFHCLSTSKSILIKVWYRIIERSWTKSRFSVYIWFLDRPIVSVFWNGSISFIECKFCWGASAEDYSSCFNNDVIIHYRRFKFQKPKQSLSHECNINTSAKVTSGKGMESYTKRQGLLLYQLHKRFLINMFVITYFSDDDFSAMGVNELEKLRSGIRDLTCTQFSRNYVSITFVRVLILNT